MYGYCLIGFSVAHIQLFLYKTTAKLPCLQIKIEIRTVLLFLKKRLEYISRNAFPQPQFRFIAYFSYPDASASASFLGKDRELSPAL